jgi:hypothetical protein
MSDHQPFSRIIRLGGGLPLRPRRRLERESLDEVRHRLLGRELPPRFDKIACRRRIRGHERLEIFVQVGQSLPHLGRTPLQADPRERVALNAGAGHVGRQARLVLSLQRAVALLEHVLE